MEMNMNDIHKRREEREFHKTWSEAFIRAEKESLFGIGFDPYSVKRYTTENIVDYLEIYKFKRRYRPTKSFRVAIKWLMVCTIGLIFGLKWMELVWEGIHEKENKKTLQSHADSIKNLKYSLNKLEVAERIRRREVKRLVEKNNKIKNSEKENKKQKVSGNKKLKRICQSAKVISKISISKNILIGTVYKNGEPHACKIYIDRDFGYPSSVYRRVGNKLCQEHCLAWGANIQRIEVNN